MESTWENDQENPSLRWTADIFLSYLDQLKFSVTDRLADMVQFKYRTERKLARKDSFWKFPLESVSNRR